MSDLAEEATESGSVSSGSSSSRYVPTYFILITKNSENTNGMKLNKYVAFCGVVTVVRALGSNGGGPGFESRY